MPDRDELEMYGLMTRIAIWCAGLAILLGLIYYAVYPTFRNMETEGIRNSNQYITTKQTLLTDLMNDYEEIEVSLLTIEDPTIKEAKKSQQKAILLRIEHEASLLEPQYVPLEVKQLLARKGN